MRRVALFSVAATAFTALGVIPAVAAPSLPLTTTQSLSLPGTSNIWAAGNANAPSGQPPQAVPVNPDSVVTVTRTGGTWSCNSPFGGPGNQQGPDGNGVTGQNCDPPLSLPSYSGLSGIQDGSRAQFIVGVFLHGTTRPTTAPPTLDFTDGTGLGHSFTSLSPQLGQLFFIGDGLTGTGSGAIQQFTAPEGATELYLGYVDDPNAYNDNQGAVTATVNDTSAQVLYSTPAASPATSPDASVLAYSNSGPAVATLLSTARNPRVSPDGHWLGYLAGGDANSTSHNDGLYVVDLTAANPTPTAIVNPNLNDYLVGFSFTPDDQYVIYDFSCGVWKAPLATPNPAHPTGAGITQLDSHMSAGTDSAGNSLYCYDDEPAVSPDGQWVAFHNDDTNYTVGTATWTAADNGLWYVDTAGANAPVHVAGTQYGDGYPAWSPDGQFLSFQSNGPAAGGVTPDGNYYKIKPFDATFQRGSGMLTDANGSFGPMGAWTADGSDLVVPGTVGGLTSVYTISTNGNETITAVPDTSGANAPQFVGAVFGNVAQTVSAAPTVTGVSPATGPAAGGTSVTITGTGFSTAAGATTFAFGPKPATGVNCNSTTSCTATSPQGSGTVDVEATVAGQTSAANPPGDQFAYQAPAPTPLPGPVIADYPPVAAFTDHPGPAGTKSTFDGTSSFDPGGSVTGWAWTFGDGSSGAGAVTDHDYTSPGDYTVTLTVTDNGGLTRSASATLAISTNQPPVASWQVQTAPAGSATKFDGSASTDPDDPIVSLVWSFGDGTTGYGATPSHVYASAGDYTVVLTATDSGGLTGTAVGTISLVPSTSGQGYWLTAADGGVFAFAAAHFKGSLGGYPLNAPIVAFAPTSDGLGYWLVAADGGVFAFADAHFKGSLGGARLNAPIVAFAPTSDGLGYWLVAADGGVFVFGDAYFKGSLAGYPLNAPIIAFAPTPGS